jgi:hypothetical protein
VTEPIRLAEARVQVNGDRIVAGPLVAAFGASEFDAERANVVLPLLAELLGLDRSNNTGKN